MTAPARNQELRKGCTRQLLPATGVLALLWILEWGIRKFILAHYITDDAAYTLYPFRNSYIIFSQYALTLEYFTFETFGNLGGTFRFFLIAVAGYIVYFLIAGLFSLLKLDRHKAIKYVTGFLFYFVFVVAFLTGYFIPYGKTIIDTDQREVRVTNYGWYLFPSSKETISFSQIDSITTGFDHVSTDKGREVSTFLQVYLWTGGNKFHLGSLFTGSAHSRGTNENERILSNREKELAEDVRSTISKLTGKE